MTILRKQPPYKLYASSDFDKVKVSPDDEMVEKNGENRYEECGVSIKEADLLMKAVKPIIKETHNQNVIGNMELFGSAFSMVDISGSDMVLVSSCDGVGTKAKLAQEFNKLSTIGYDIVNHSVNDILCMGAKPIFMLDYMGVNKLNRLEHAKVIIGFANAAKEHEIAVIGGETAEMPHVYRNDRLELIGFIVGAVERNKMLPSKQLCDTDIIIGFPSSGPHTNGYTLIDQLIETGKIDPNEQNINEIMEPHRSYYKMVKPLVDRGLINGLAHITGGGFDNILRIIPDGIGVKIKKDSWKIPHIFKKIQAAGRISDEEMFKVYNMGIGMVAVINAVGLHWITQTIGFDNFYVIGLLEESKEKVIKFV